MDKNKKIPRVTMLLLPSVTCDFCWYIKLIFKVSVGRREVSIIYFHFHSRQVKKSSAMTEKAWKGCGQKVGIKIWRIVKFKASVNILR